MFASGFEEGGDFHLAPARAWSCHSPGGLRMGNPEARNSAAWGPYKVCLKKKESPTLLRRTLEEGGDLLSHLVWQYHRR